MDDSNIIYFSKDIIEIVIIIGKEKFRINSSEMKHFTDRTRFVGDKAISKEEFYDFANYLVSTSNEWDDNFFVKSINPEAKWSILIKSANSGTKRYESMDCYPNNWKEFFNTFMNFIKNKNIEDIDTNKTNITLNTEDSINFEYNHNGITSKLINEIKKYTIMTIEDDKLDIFWSDYARTFLGLIIISSLVNGTQIKTNNLLEMIKNIDNVKMMVLNNIHKINHISELQEFIGVVKTFDADRTLKSIMEIIESNLKYYVLKNGLESNYAVQIEELEKKANAGDKDAMQELALKYEEGKEIEKNLEKAYSLYKTLADGYDDFFAKLRIAYMYYFGNEYVKQNFNIAFEMFNEIKNEDIDGEILFYIGYMYINGYGTEKNPKLGIEYYKKSAQKGFTFAEFSLGYAILQEDGTKANDAEAVYWLSRAAEKGNENAQYVLGMLYYEGYNNGFAIIKNEEKGLNLIKMASEKGYMQAIEALKKLENIEKTIENDDDEYNVEDYIGFTNIDNFNMKDDVTDNYDLVCGIKIEKDYIDGRIELVTIYDISTNVTFDMDGDVEVRSINKEEIVLRMDDTKAFRGIKKCEYAEEYNKIDVTLDINKFITGWSTKTIPATVSYKIKVLYVRKKDRNVIK